MFERYSAEMYEKTHDRVEERATFAADKVGRAAYADAALTLA